MVDIIGLLSTDGYIMCNKELIRMFGADCAILIGELCSEYIYFANKGLAEDGWFPSSQENIENQTGLNTYAQRKAMDILVRNGIIMRDRRDVPARNYYQICPNQLLEIFKSRCLNFKHLDVQNLNIYNNNNNINNNSNPKGLHNPSGCIDNFNQDESNSDPNTEKPKRTRKPRYEACTEAIDSMIEDESVREALHDYLPLVCKQLRGANQFIGMLKTLKTMTHQLEVVRASIEHGWMTFVPYEDLKGGNNRFLKNRKENVFSEYKTHSTPVIESGGGDIVDESF